MQDDLFFIAVLIEGETGHEVTEMKYFCADRFNSSRALNSPPHLTIIPPFRFNLQKIRYMEEAITQILKGQSSFCLTLNGFGHFRRDVIFIQSEDSKELNTLYDKFAYFFTSKKLYQKTQGRAFHPHLTIAFRDLKADQYQMAWEFFGTKEFLRVVEINKIALLKHDGKKWQIFKKFTFQ